jgi:hypothetical protein
MNRRSILRLLGLAPIAAPAALAAASKSDVALPAIDYSALTAQVGENIAVITSEAEARATADLTFSRAPYSFEIRYENGEHYPSLLMLDQEGRVAHRHVARP